MCLKSLSSPSPTHLAKQSNYEQKEKKKIHLGHTSHMAAKKLKNQMAITH